jgi:hypothetical protein
MTNTTEECSAFVADSYPRDLSPTNPDGSLSAFEDSFGSAHPGVVSGVFGDGATSSISFNIDADVMQDICFRDDDYPVDLGDF